MNRTCHLLLLLLALTTSKTVAQIRIIFSVDVGDLPVAPGGVHVAGTFNTLQSLSIQKDWDLSAPGSQLELVSGSVYSVAVDFPVTSAGSTLTFQFSRDSTWINENGDVSEGNPGDCCLGNSCGTGAGSGGFDRTLIVPNCGGRYACIWNLCAALEKISPPTLQIVPGSQAICKGDTVRLSAISNGDVVWRSHPTLSCSMCNDALAKPTTRTWYLATATNAACGVKDSVWLDPKVPFLNVAGDTFVCAGSTVQLESHGNGGFSWSPADHLSCTACPSPLGNPKKTTQYKVVMRLGSCRLEDSVKVDVDSNYAEAGTDQTIRYGESARLEGNAMGTPLWNPTDGLSCSSCLQPKAAPEYTTTYNLTATSPNGCEVIDSVTVVVKSKCGVLEIANLLTLNRDERNDRFTLQSIGKEPFCRIDFNRIEIFDRWGLERFHSSDRNFVWPDSEISDGVYYYAIHLKDRSISGWMQVTH